VVPENPKIYHITHIENLTRMIDHGLWSDAERIRQGIDCTVVGMTEIKRRRLEENVVDCHPRTKVGEDVPFYFCFRSVMLYLLHMGNHPDVSYRGGQRPILHLESDVKAVVQWAEASEVGWAFSKGNAGARYMSFSKDLKKLSLLDWGAIAATDWEAPSVRDPKQAEFLVERFLPWNLIERIGVIDENTAADVEVRLANARHKPEIVVTRNWYY